jgi:PAS domain S-box-containing protein
MESEWAWSKLDQLERDVAELLIQGKGNDAIAATVYHSRGRVQDCIRRILTKTGTDSTRGAIALLVEERENTSLLRILDQVADGVVIVQDRIVVFANRAMHRIQEFKPYEMHGRPMIELLAPRSRDLVMKRYEMRVGGEFFTQSYVVGILCKGGHEKDVLAATGGTIQYRGKPARLGILTDRL